MLTRLTGVDCVSKACNKAVRGGKTAAGPSAGRALVQASSKVRAVSPPTMAPFEPALFDKAKDSNASRTTAAVCNKNKRFITGLAYNLLIFCGKRRMREE